MDALLICLGVFTISVLYWLYYQREHQLKPKQERKELRFQEDLQNLTHTQHIFIYGSYEMLWYYTATLGHTCSHIDSHTIEKFLKIRLLFLDVLLLGSDIYRHVDIRSMIIYFLLKTLDIRHERSVTLKTYFSIK